jgi:hypothetical protein
MNKISIHQAEVWSHQILTKSQEIKKESQDNFDSMLFIESKEVRNVLPVIVASLNTMQVDEPNDLSTSRRYSNALSSLTRAARDTYGDTENPIMSAINEVGNEKVKSDFQRLNEIAAKVSIKKAELDSEISMTR